MPQHLFPTTQRRNKTTSDRPRLLWLKRRGALRLLVLLGLGTLDLGGTGEGLLTVLALLACGKCVSGLFEDM
jgi:hypothetical protein